MLKSPYEPHNTDVLHAVYTVGSARYIPCLRPPAEMFYIHALDDEILYTLLSSRVSLATLSPKITLGVPTRIHHQTVWNPTQASTRHQREGGRNPTESPTRSAPRRSADRETIRTYSDGSGSTDRFGHRAGREEGGGGESVRRVGRAQCRAHCVAQ